MVANIMGEGFLTSYQQYLNMLGLFEIKQTQAMAEGNLYEAEAREAFEGIMGFKLPPLCGESAEYYYMSASLDGINFENKCILEIKTGGQKATEDARAYLIPMKYRIQMQYQLFISEMDTCYYYFWDKINKVGYPVQVLRDEALINKIVKEVHKFWRNYIDFIPPAFTDRDYVERSGEWDEKAKALLEVQSVIKKLEEIETNLRDELIGLSEGQNSFGGGIRLTKVVRGGAVQYSDIPELQGVDLNKYRKAPVESWRVTKIKEGT